MWETGLLSQTSRGATRAARFTSEPGIQAPLLLCPTCADALIYRHTMFSGVRPLERWDYFTCVTHGRFEYRERTHRLRPTDL